MMNVPKQSLKRTFGKVLKLYLLYALITGVVVFAIPITKDRGYQDQIDPKDFLGEGQGADHIVLLDNPYLAGLARHDLIAHAQHSIDVAYYSLHRDYSADALFGALFEAADRGVHVRILLDGISHGMTGSLRAMRYAAVHHENIELKFYEPFDLLRPWTWNNRFHDKYIVADDRWAIIGGRNVGLRYFDPNSKRPVNDRDVLIMNQESKTGTASVLHQLNDYFDDQWNQPYAQNARVPLRIMAERLIASGRKRTDQVIREIRTVAQTYFEEEMDWQSLALPTKKITLIHNPMGRFNKEPWILMELAALMENAQERFLIQSPYVIPTEFMKRYLPKDTLDAEIAILTNHPASRANSNILAVAGYQNKKRTIEEFVDKIHEYHNSHSLHAKTYVFDRTLSLVGSFNFDARSSFLSTESMVVIDSPEFAQVLEKHVENTIKESLADQRMALLRGMAIGVFRVILWPFGFLL
ncbi:MAG TPA: phospholipase [Firmicutes bacterium]|jgi:putative cardiolipin synthase|nr:phospholipase [Bacillota bacterium]